jgi:hypothetical protein
MAVTTGCLRLVLQTICCVSTPLITKVRWFRRNQLSADRNRPDVDFFNKS